MIRIVMPPSGKTGIGTKVTTPDGAEIEGITSIDISLRPDSLVTAKVEVLTAGIDLPAHPLLGLETVRAAADAYGFVLVQK